MDCRVQERLALGQEEGGPVEMVYWDNRRPAALALLLLHGLFDHKATWDPLCSLLGDRFRLVAPDLIGAGQSSKPRFRGWPPCRRYSLQMHAGHLEQLVEHLGLGELVLVGNSLGGGLALYLWCTCSRLRPLIRGLVLIDAACYAQPLPGYVRRLAGWPGALLNLGPIQWLVAALGIASPLVRQTFARCFFDPRKIPRDAVRAAVELLRAPGVLYAYRAAAQNAIPPDHEALIRAYRDITCPVLVIWGSQDRIVPPAFARRLQEDIPRAAVHFIDQCGHAPQLECPAQVAGLVEAWAQRL